MSHILLAILVWLAPMAAIGFVTGVILAVKWMQETLYEDP